MPTCKYCGKPYNTKRSRAKYPGYCSQRCVFGLYPRIKERDWTNGYYSIFAYALHLRYALPIYAILEVARSDGAALLCHAVAVRGPCCWDANGQSSLAEMAGGYEPGYYYPDEPADVTCGPITIERLGEVHHDFCTDPEMVDQALAFIDKHPDRFFYLNQSAA